MSPHKKQLRVQELETLGVLSAFFLILSIVLHRQALAGAAADRALHQTAGGDHLQGVAEILRGGRDLQQQTDSLPDLLSFLDPDRVTVQNLYKEPVDVEDGKRRFVLHRAQPHL
jgi:hypothetical protein